MQLTDVFEVSNPNGLPRPFSLGNIAGIAVAQKLFQTQTGFPGHLACRKKRCTFLKERVSNPNGLPRPFSLARKRITMSWVHLFQTQTGFPGHLAPASNVQHQRSLVGFKPK